LIIATSLNVPGICSEVVGFVAGNQTKLGGRITRQVSHNVADASLHDVSIGYDVPVGADDEAGAALIEHLGGLLRRARGFGRRPGKRFGGWL
jgi:hypothetical protein